MHVHAISGKAGFVKQLPAPLVLFLLHKSYPVQVNIAVLETVEFIVLLRRGVPETDTQFEINSLSLSP